MSCDCEFQVDPDNPDEDGEKPWHYRRVCLSCGGVWWGLHCPHDGYQNPCPSCGVRPETVHCAGTS